MKNTRVLLLLSLALISLVSWKTKRQVDDWVYEREKKGIKIFTKKSKWGKLRDSKAVMIVSSTPEQMAKLITDFDNYYTWLPRCRKARIVARLNEHEFIAQIVFNAPWPIKDRDCVIRVKTQRDPKTGIITITETSEPKYIREEDDVVRIQQMTSIWKFVPKAGGTEVTNEYGSNPGGSIPDWIANTESVETPLTTFENLKHKASVKK